MISLATLSAVNWGQVAQMITACAVVATLYLGPKSNFKTNQRIAIAKSRQDWLDAVRADIAELIATHDSMVRAASTDEQRSSYRMNVMKLAARVRMRLNVRNQKQAAVYNAVVAYAKSESEADESFNAEKIYDALDPLTTEIWALIKSAEI